jgi:hypothetical protein
MNPDAYWYILLAALAGGFGGVLVMWDRRRLEAVGASKLRRAVVISFGTAASACALFGFTRAFGAGSRVHAAVVMVLMTGWVALLQLPAPRVLLKVRVGEFRLLQSPWTGVRLFGALLKRTPLRHLGGKVFLSGAGQDLGAVLRGIQQAEAVHLWALCVCCPWLMFWAWQGWWTSVVWSLAIHVPINLYPVLHLRLATGRIERHLARTRCDAGR